MGRVLALTLAPESARPQDGPLTLDTLPDVLTDADLARLLRVSSQWPAQQRFYAKRRGRAAADLPPCIRGMRHVRYRKEDVLTWLRRRGERRS